MVNLLVNHKVEDYKKWRPIYDEHESTRKQFGMQSSRVFQKVDEPNRIFILFEWDNEANASRFFESTDLRETMKRAGVIGMPEATVLKST